MAGRRDTPAFAKGILRTVRGSLKRFVALTTITALGVTMLVGLRAACVDLRNSADRFFDEQSLFDVRVQSTLGLTDEDVAALAALDGVEVAEGGWSETAYTTVGSASEKVDVKALSSSGLNEPLVLEGRLPEAPGEVAVTERYLKDSGNEIGDVVSFRGDDETDDTAEKDEGIDALDSGSTEVFERGEYTIVGSVLDPMEINAGEGTMSFRSSGGSQYSFFVVADEVIDPDVYTVAYVMVEGAEAPLCYSAEYEEVVDEVFQSVEDVLRGGKAVLRLFFEELEDRRLEIRIAIELFAEARRRHKEVFGDGNVNRIAVERRDTREHFVGDAAHRIEIGGRGDNFVFELLRRHISRRACHIIVFMTVPDFVVVVFRNDLRDAEIEHFDEIPRKADAFAQHDVGRFEVSVDKSVGMRLDERLEDLNENLNGSFGGKRARFVEQILELFAGDEFHRDIWQSLGRSSDVVKKYRIRSV